MVDGAGHGDDEVARTVVRPVVLPHRRSRRRADRLGASADRAAERMLPQHGLEEALVGDVSGVVARHREFLQNDAALVLELVGIEKGRREHVGEDLDRHRQVAILHLRVVAGVLLRGERIVLPADGVERDRDVERRAFRRALEEQVLEEVRRSVGRRVRGIGPLLVARPDGDPEADRDASAARHLFAQDPHT